MNPSYHHITPFLPLVIFLFNDSISKILTNDTLDILSMFLVSSAIITYHQGNVSNCMILYISFYGFQLLKQKKNTINNSNNNKNYESYLDDVDNTCRQEDKTVEENETENEIKEEKQEESVEGYIDDYFDTENKMIPTSFEHRQPLISTDIDNNVFLRSYNE